MLTRKVVWVLIGLSVSAGVSWRTSSKPWPRFPVIVTAGIEEDDDAEALLYEDDSDVEEGADGTLDLQLSRIAVRGTGHRSHDPPESYKSFPFNEPKFMEETATEFLGDRVSTFKEHTRFVYAFENVCVEGKTGKLFLVQEGDMPLEDCVLDIQQGLMEPTKEILPWVKKGTLPQTTELYASTTLWTLKSFDHTNLGHWIIFAIYPYLALTGSLFSPEERAHILLNVLEPNPHGPDHNLTSAVTGTGRPSEHFTPDTTVCFAKGYFGVPSVTQPPSPHTPYFDEFGHVALHRLRRFFWHFVQDNFDRITPSFVAAQQNPKKEMVYLTYRKGTDGQTLNLTNVDELAVAFEAHPTYPQRAKVMKIAWSEFSLLEQMYAATLCDVLVGVHGNNLAWITLMRTGSVVVELYPFGMNVSAKAINPGEGELNGKAFWPYTSARLNVNFLTWVSSDGDNSPYSRLAFPGRRSGRKRSRKPPLHCRQGAIRLWSCRHLTLPTEVFYNLLAVAFTRLGRYTEESQDGMFQWEKDELNEHGKLLH